MGVFGGGAGVDVAAIAETMRPILAQWFNGRFQIIRPADQERLRYDPVTDTYADPLGGAIPTAEVLYDSGEHGALFQPIRSAAPITVATQGTTIQSVRIQASRDAAAHVQSGLLVRILDGGQDASLEPLVYSLKGQPGTSLAWGAILEATVVASSRWD